MTTKKQNWFGRNSELGWSTALNLAMTMLTLVMVGAYILNNFHSGGGCSPNTYFAPAISAPAIYPPPVIVFVIIHWQLIVIVLTISVICLLIYKFFYGKAKRYP